MMPAGWYSSDQTGYYQNSGQQYQQPQEATTEKILLEPWVKNTDGLNREKLKESNKRVGQ